MTVTSSSLLPQDFPKETYKRDLIHTKDHKKETYIWTHTWTRESEPPNLNQLIQTQACAQPDDVVTLSYIRLGLF